MEIKVIYQQSSGTIIKHNLDYTWVKNKFLIWKRQVTTEEGMLKAKELEVLFMEVSAKSGSNINSLFQMIAGSLPSNENSQLMFQSAMNMSTTPNHGK